MDSVSAVYDENDYVNITINKVQFILCAHGSTMKKKKA